MAVRYGVVASDDFPMGETFKFLEERPPHIHVYIYIYRERERRIIIIVRIHM